MGILSYGPAMLHSKSRVLPHPSLLHGLFERCSTWILYRQRPVIHGSNLERLSENYKKIISILSRSRYIYTGPCAMYFSSRKTTPRAEGAALQVQNHFTYACNEHYFTYSYRHNSEFLDPSCFIFWLLQVSVC